MDLHEITQTLQRDAVWFVFVNVLLQQLGMPIPAVPVLMVAGSLMLSTAQASEVLAAIVLASVLADWIWYLAGRAFGYRILTGLCKLSINPASCVSQTESRFVRWGLWSLVFAKFIPGFSTVAPPIAGSLRMSLPGFLIAAGTGALLWGGSALAAGWIFRAELSRILMLVDRNSAGFLITLVAVFGTWLLWKFWQKYRFEKLAAIPHITPGELLAAMASATPPLILDLRGATAHAETGIVPNAVAADYENLQAAVGDWPKSALIVTLCACPQDAGAVQAARELIAAGYLLVRPLRGGFEALPEALKPASLSTKPLAAR